MLRSGALFSSEQSLKIGTFSLGPPLVLAPMAGFSDRAFRELCRQLGSCPWSVAPLISASALHYPSSRQRTYQLFDWSDEASPRLVQLLGNDPLLMAEAARLLCDKGADIIDINMACQVPKVTKKGGGAALLRDFSLCRKIFLACRQAVNVPITVKLRLGWDSFTIAPLVEELRDLGASAFFVHARTAQQAFNGPPQTSCWSSLVKAAGPLPLVANGNMEVPAYAEKALSDGCQAIMLGRCALRDPGIFSRYCGLPSISKKNIARLHLKLAEQYNSHSETCLIRKLRGHMLRVFPQLREELESCRSLLEMDALLQASAD